MRSLKYILAMGGNVQVSVKHRSWLIGMMSARTTIRIGRDREVSVKLVLRSREGEEVPEPKLSPGTRFIDVQKMKLVTAKIECEFVALSCVWFSFLF